MIMRNIPYHLANLLMVLWVGGVWAIGYIAVPVLFNTLPDRLLAGMLAGNLFTCMAYVGIGCAMYVMAFQIYRNGRGVWKQTSFKLVIILLLMVIIGQFGIQPVMTDLKAQAFPLDVMHSPLATEFKTMHGLASILYLLQSILGIVLLTIKFPKEKLLEPDEK